MKKELLNNVKVKKLLSQTEKSSVFEIEGNKVIKIYEPLMLNIMEHVKFDIENRILNAKKIDAVPEIIIPETAIYTSKGNFVGYTMKKANGISVSEKVSNESYDDITNLNLYATKTMKLEDIVKRANKENIFFPDFLTLDNIFVDEANNYQFIDYEGIQIKNNWVLSYSTALGDEKKYESKKYSTGMLRNENLDKQSLIYYYFLDTFNIDLSKVNTKAPNGKIITLDMIFNSTGIDNDDLKHKVWLTTNDKKDNEYLDDVPKQIAEEYNLAAIPLNNRIYAKRLIKK